MSPSKPTQALVDLIEDFRRELESELPVRLHTSAGDAGSFSTDAPRRTNQPASVGWTGLPFSGSFARYLGHPSEYGYEFIAAASFDEIRDYCRSKHVDQAGNMLHAAGPTDSMCKRFAVAVVELRQPIAFVAAVEGVGIFAVRAALTDVLTHAAEWRSRKRMAAAMHDTEAEPPSLAETLHRQHDEAREQKVWERMRHRHPYLPELEVERARRLDQHRKLGCPECRVDAA